MRRKRPRDFSAILDAGSHPLGVLPLGNSLFDGPAGLPAQRRKLLGAGALAALPDELLVAVLECLGFADLCRCATVSGTLYVFSQLEDLWRERCLEDFTGNFTFWGGTWKRTYHAARLLAQQPERLFGDVCRLV